jgi:type IV pilus assembly protein PilB
MERLGLKDLPEDFRVYEGRGCAGCDGTGYQGRIAIFEILEVTDGIRALVAKGAPANEIHAEARVENMMTLFDSGLKAVIKGITTTDEIIRMVKRDSV